MLRSNETGYAVMTEDLSAITFESIDFEACKRWCRDGYVIARRIPKVCGFAISIRCYSFHKPIFFKLRWRQANVLWLHFNWNKEYRHKTEKIVYKP